MRYAILSDIHGNMPALTAALQETRTMAIDRYIFVGDYSAYLFNPAQVIDTLRQLEATAGEGREPLIVRGNEEDYFIEYARQDQATWTDGQFQAHYWTYRAIDAPRHAYLAGLPKTLRLQDQGIPITISHVPNDICGPVKGLGFSSFRVANAYQHLPDYTRQRLLDDVAKFIAEYDFVDTPPLEDGIYIFGHSHLQWHAWQGGKLLINPGSCGLPLDGTPGAPYTILDIQNHRATVTEHRAHYDLDALIADFKASSLYAAAAVWSGVILRELIEHFEYAWPFLQFAAVHAQNINDPIRPYTKQTWEQAYELWQKSFRKIP